MALNGEVVEVSDDVSQCWHVVVGGGAAMAIVRFELCVKDAKGNGFFGGVDGEDEFFAEFVFHDDRALAGLIAFFDADGSTFSGKGLFEVDMGLGEGRHKCFARIDRRALRALVN